MKKLLLLVVFVLAAAAGVWYAMQDDKAEVPVAQSEEVVADSLTISEKKAIAETVADSAVAVTDSIVTAE